MSHGGGMYFHTNVMNTILFEKWHTMTWEELLGSCIGIAVLAALYEGLKVGREFVDMRLSSKASKQAAQHQQHQQQQPACECNATDESSMKTTADSTVIAIGEDQGMKKQKNRPDIISLRHIIQTGLHFLQLWIGFCLMLVFMTFSVYLCLAITIGGAIGYFCFAWLRPRTHFDYSGPYSSSDCCN
jgi:solute carrier family 31 (copper transporter), member 1